MNSPRSDPNPNPNPSPNLPARVLTTSCTDHKRSDMPEPEPCILGRKIYEVMRSSSAPSYVNITLTSRDGKPVSSIRELLVLSSPFLQERLICTSEEHTNGAFYVNVKYKELVQIVEFIYIDDCPSLRLVRSCYNESKVFPCGTINELVELARAASQLQMDRLVSRCSASLNCLMVRNPQFSCVVYQALSQYSDKYIWARDLCGTAKFLTKAMPKSTLLSFHLMDGRNGCGVMHLSDQGGEKFFSEILKQNLVKRMAVVFQALLVWASNGDVVRGSVKRPTYGEFEILVDVGKMPISGQRLAVAKRIATLFDLTLFKTRFLSDAVEVSGLLDQATTARAYKKLLFQREETINILNTQASNIRPGQRENPYRGGVLYTARVCPGPYYSP